MYKPYGFYTEYGYKGLVSNKFIEFATEAEYLEYLAEVKKTD